MNKSPLRIFAVVLLVTSSVCRAQDFGPLPYDYLFANVALTQLDSSGLEVGGSIALGNNVHVFLDYQDWEFGDNFDRETVQIGGGYRWPVRPNLDFVARLAYADSKIDGPGPADVDDEGLILSGMLRAWLSNEVEVSGELSLDDSVGSGIDTVLEVGGQYYTSDGISFGGRIRVDENETTVFFGARFYFGAGRRNR